MIRDEIKAVIMEVMKQYPEYREDIGVMTIEIEPLADGLADAIEEFLDEGI